MTSDTRPMPDILAEIITHKKTEVAARKERVSEDELRRDLVPSDRDFTAALKHPGVNLIAEIKNTSPSMERVDSDLDVAAVAELYEANGAAAISVLTDAKFFDGALGNMQIARRATTRTPILCKDFMIDPYQIYEARAHDADAILLIASVLSSERMQEFLDIARSLNMSALCEVHDEEELQTVLATNADIIGINNRDLRSFTIDLTTTARLAAEIPSERIIVSESGIATSADVAALPARVNAVLVGTSIMQSKDRAGKVRELAKQNWNESC